MLAGAILILECRAGTTERNPTLNVNRVGVPLRRVIRFVNDLDRPAFENRELKSLPRGALFDGGSGIENFENVGWG